MLTLPKINWSADLSWAATPYWCLDRPSNYTHLKTDSFSLPFKSPPKCVYPSPIHFKMNASSSHWTHPSFLLLSYQFSHQICLRHLCWPSPTSVYLHHSSSWCFLVFFIFPVYLTTSCRLVCLFPDPQKAKYSTRYLMCITAFFLHSWFCVLTSSLTPIHNSLSSGTVFNLLFNTVPPALQIWCVFILGKQRDNLFIPSRLPPHSLSLSVRHHLLNTRDCLWLLQLLCSVYDTCSVSDTFKSWNISVC